MDDVALVRRLQGGEEVAGDARRLLRRKTSLALQALPERLATDVLHDEIPAAVVVAAVVHRDDVGVVEQRRRLRLDAEALDELVVVGEGRAQHLDGDLPAEAHVLGEEHVGHAAAAELRGQAIATVQQPPVIRGSAGVVECRVGSLAWAIRLAGRRALADRLPAADAAVVDRESDCRRWPSACRPGRLLAEPRGVAQRAASARPRTPESDPTPVQPRRVQSRRGVSTSRRLGGGVVIEAHAGGDHCPSPRASANAV